MALTSDMMEKLTCSKCEMYLSATPVKVYPNRHVKCARCSKENDGGVVSPLYEMVAKKLKFPCVNHYDGCKEVLYDFEVKFHEKMCVNNVCYDCPLCASFNGTAYKLNLHIRMNHSKDILQYQIFLIKLDYDFHEQLFVYCKNSLLVFLSCKYDSMLKQVELNASSLGQSLLRNIKCQFLFHSIEDVTVPIDKTNNIICSTLGLLDTDKCSKITVLPERYPSKTIICNFVISEDSGMVHAAHDQPVYFHPYNKALVLVTTRNVSSLPQKSPKLLSTFVVCGIPYMSFILQAENTIHVGFVSKSKCLFDVWGSLTLISCIESKSISKPISVMSTKSPVFPVSFANDMGNIDYIFNPLNGFVHNDTLKFEIRIDRILERKPMGWVPEKHICKN